MPGRFNEVAIERARRARVLRDQGFKYAEIGRIIGQVDNPNKPVSGTRVSQMIKYDLDYQIALKKPPQEVMTPEFKRQRIREIRIHHGLPVEECYE